MKMYRKSLLKDQNVSHSSQPPCGRVKGHAECIRPTSSSFSVGKPHLYLTVIPFLKVSMTDFKGQYTSKTLHAGNEEPSLFPETQNKKVGLSACRINEGLINELSVM